MCVATSPRPTTLDGYILGPRGAAIGQVVQDQCDVQYPLCIALIAWGVPPGAEDPLSRADRGRE